MKYTAIVPARSGSKRIRDKNITMLAGKPLVVWTLEACVNVEKIDSVIISTDSKEYWDLVNEYISSDKLKLDFREQEDAGDQVKIFDYIKNKSDKIFFNNSEVFILALPTVPLRSYSHIEECILLYEKTNQPVFSACEYEFPVSFSFSMSNDKWKPYFKDSPMMTGNTRSQNQITSYHPNGAIYVREIKDLQNKELSTLYENAIPYFMEREYSIDIDTNADLAYADFMIKRLKEL